MKKLHSTISRFLFDEAEKAGLQVNEISITIEANYDDDKYIDIIVSDMDWKELTKYKSLTGL
jgi:hypothetical protein